MLRCAGVFALVWLGTQGCGTSPVGVTACKQIEEARCKRAPACGVSLEPPYSTAGGDVNECIRFYDVACLHGLAVADPGADAVNACVASIETSPCDGRLPLFETDDACAWLTNLPSSDASTEPEAESEANDSASDAAEAGSDASETGADAAEAGSE
jgi:hypothetical protein